MNIMETETEKKTNSNDDEEESTLITTNSGTSTNRNYNSISGSTVSSAESSLSGIGTIELPTEADHLASGLIACGDDEVLQRTILNKSFSLSGDDSHSPLLRDEFPSSPHQRRHQHHLQHQHQHQHHTRPTGIGKSMIQRIVAMVSLAVLGLMIIVVLLQVGTLLVGPPSEPVGQYKLVEIQEGRDFFNHYTFYSGEDSLGSMGYVNYVSKEEAYSLKLANVTLEKVDPSVYSDDDDDESDDDDDNNSESNTKSQNSTPGTKKPAQTEPFVYMSTSPTEGGPRNSIRLEGLKRYNRGLFILDVRHMPAGCATWPAFWLSDEPNWPVNGEIDILEGVNDQTVTKTALHTSMKCKMDDVPLGVKTGYWDTAVGVPKKNGDLDMTVREATDCYVYDPHQWLNQGCVAMSDQEGSIGEPLNKKGGGIFALEWDPINKHMSSFAFTPHTSVPENLRDTIRTASHSDISKRVKPDPRLWGLPYAYFPIGEATQCSSDHFRNMHIIFNMALCGSVAGNRFFKDCPELNKKYGSCDNYVKANTPEMDEVYWKIRGLYVYEREWERSWPN